MKAECPGFIPTHCDPDVPPGQSHIGFRCEELERPTFADSSFDLVIIQDVFEYVMDSAKGFPEIARMLKPGAEPGPAAVCWVMV